MLLALGSVGACHAILTRARGEKVTSIRFAPFRPSVHPLEHGKKNKAREGHKIFQWFSEKFGDTLALFFSRNGTTLLLLVSAYIPHTSHLLLCLPELAFFLDTQGSDKHIF